MSLVSPQPGDLATIKSSFNHKILFYQLRHFVDKKFYISPMIMVEPNDIVLILLVEDEDSLVCTTSGQIGWINGCCISVISEFKNRFTF